MNGCVIEPVGVIWRWMAAARQEDVAQTMRERECCIYLRVAFEVLPGFSVHLFIHPFIHALQNVLWLLLSPVPSLSANLSAAAASSWWSSSLVDGWMEEGRASTTTEQPASPVNHHR